MMKIFLSLLAIAQPASAATTYIEGFQKLQEDGELVWPLPESHGGESIVSAFGPRIENDKYDFHRGMDFRGKIGDKILAPYKGVVEKLYDFKRGGLTIVLKHELPEPVHLHNNHQETSLFYTFYMHCNEILVQKEDEVDAGDVIATLGDTGKTFEPHLHLDVRFGTSCSLEYAVTNPDSTCNTLGFDPHINPLLLLSKHEVGASDIRALYNDNKSNQKEKVVVVSAPVTNPNVNAYKIFIINTKTRRVRKWYFLDLNLRTGFDATSVAALDTVDKNFPYLQPMVFSSKKWKTELRIPRSWYGEKGRQEKVIVAVVDIWGQATKMNFGKGEKW